MFVGLNLKVAVIVFVIFHLYLLFHTRYVGMLMIYVVT
jgi:hypothetical protein